MKDPAVLIYFDKWISSTNGMKAEFRAWYLDLIIYQYDKGSIPIDLDEMAGICRVRPSEYDSFKQMVEQVVKQKFEIIDGAYFNHVIGEILRKREQFKDKREKSGNIGVIIKAAKAIEWCTDKAIDRLKTHLFSLDLSEILKFKNNQVLEQMLKLYINEDEDENIIKNKGKGVQGEKPSRNKEFLNSALESPSWIEVTSAQQKTTKEEIIKRLNEFYLMLEAQTDFKLNKKDFLSHFVNWCSSKKTTPNGQKFQSPI